MAVAELWESLKQALAAYTGFSPATFFTAIVLAGALYYLVFGQARPEPVRAREPEVKESEPLPPPVQLGEVTEEDLRAYDGTDPKKPLLMAIKSQVYDVTQSRMFYGPGGPYALFAGKDASRALAKMSFDESDLTSDISVLGPSELEALQDWEYKFMSKYVKVGTIKKNVPVIDGSSSNPPETTNTATPATEGSSSNSAHHLAELQKGDHGAEPNEHPAADRDAELMGVNPSAAESCLEFEEDGAVSHFNEPKMHLPANQGAEVKVVDASLAEHSSELEGNGFVFHSAEPKAHIPASVTGTSADHAAEETKNSPEDHIAEPNAHILVSYVEELKRNPGDSVAENEKDNSTDSVQIAKEEDLLVDQCAETKDGGADECRKE